MEFVVEPLVPGLFNGLFKILGSNEVRDFARQFLGGVDSELEDLEKKLSMIENLLRNAEDKQLTDESVKQWLHNLQHWAYDAEDLLGEFAYQARRRKLKAEDQASSSKGISCLPACFPTPLFNVQIGSKMKDITIRLEQLRQERSAIQEFSGGTSSNVAAPQRPEETSSVRPEQLVHGRDEDEAILLEMVKNDQPRGANNFRVIAIVGMGGIGKTTIAREVYHHKDLDSFKFDKAWACVSHDFDILTISKNILGSLGRSLSSNLNNLNEAQVELQKAVNGKKFLIVLDDVWEVDYLNWEKFTSPFKTGASGSTMMVTTRSGDVAKAIRCSEYTLKHLSDGACWSLFQEHALASGTAADDRIPDSIYEKVVKRCGGLPLAAKILGGLLHSKRIDTWEEILESRIWNLSKEKILPVLKLSYLYLPSHLKRCFAYCSIFPEDYKFEEKELVLLWMAEGIIQPFDEQLGETGACFSHLCSRSFFQKSSDDGSKYVMHDLIHDLAESVSKEFYFRSEKSIIELPKNIKKVRHFSYISDEYEGGKKFKGLEKLKGLRTFLPVPNKFYHWNNYITGMVIFDLLPELKKLRVLSLEDYCITHLPDSIGDLMHLRYLNFSNTKIKSLPESTSQLFNLQTLLLKDCSCLVKLPSDLRYLTNLYHLDISGQNSLKEMPSGMKELKNLRILSRFIVGKELSSNLEDLKSLSFLGGELHISKLKNVNNVTQIGGSILSNKKDLKVLLLEWRSQFDGSRVERVEKEVLEMLKPHSNLEELEIRFYGGLEFPSWLSTSSSLSKLTVLKLENCENCTSLPSESLLSSLRELIIKGMSKLERIDMRIPCHSLEILCFKNLQKCQYWDIKGENENVQRFPKLRELSIIDCPKLIVELLDHLPLLEKLVIDKCPKWMLSFSSFPKLSELRINECEEVVSTSNSSIELMSFNSESLPNIAQNFTCVEKPIKSSHGLASLKSLDIRNCSISFLNTVFHPNLRDLEIRNCEALKSLPKRLKQNNIESLRIKNCDSLLFIARNTLPSSLKWLRISFCKNLQHLEGISSTALVSLMIYQCDSLTRLSSRRMLPKTLKSLVIGTCPNLTTLSSRSWCTLETLEYLSIHGCPKLKSIEEAFHNNPCLQRIDLSGLQNLESNRLFGLQNLTGLRQLSIEDCLVSLPIESIPTSLTNLHIKKDVEISKTLIRRGLNNLTSLKHLQIRGFEDPELILPEDQRMPTSLKSLDVYNFAPFKSISDLGTLTSLIDLTIADSPNLHSIPQIGSLISLKSFSIKGCPKIKSIPSLGSHSSLKRLSIDKCQNLKSITCLGRLTSLHSLSISSCPKLKSLPCLPSSLLELFIERCPLLKKRWRRCKGKYSSKIAHIPHVEIDNNIIFNLKEEE